MGRIYWNSQEIHLLMTQLSHTSTTTDALYTNPEQEKAKKAAKQEYQLS